MWKNKKNTKIPFKIFIGMPSEVFFFLHFFFDSFGDFLTLLWVRKLIKRRINELTNKRRNWFDLVPMKHEQAVHDGIDIQGEETHPSWNHMFLLLCSPLESSQTIPKRSLDDEKSFKPTKIKKTYAWVSVCVCMCVSV